MEQSLSKYYEQQFALFIHPGWKDLLEDLERLKTSINDLSAVKTPDDLWYRKGQLDILDLLLNRRKTCEEVYEGLQNEANV